MGNHVDLSKFFSHDLNKLPDSSCTIVTDEYVRKGDTHYYKQLTEWERGIFTIFKIVTFEDSPNKNFLFSNPDFESVDIEYVKLLVNDLVNILGRDDYQEGYFTEKDVEDIGYEDWEGRSWNDPNRKGDLVNFYLDGDEGFSLTVWQVNPKS